MPNRFEGVALKLSWAEKHLKNLDFEVSTFLQGNPCVAVRVNDLRSGEDVWTAKLLAFPPQWWSPMIGDIVHSLRSSLDYIVWELAKPTNRHHRLQFPICDTPEAYGAKAAQAQIKGLDDYDKALIESFQPFKSVDRGYHLSLLRALSNFEKHREPLLSFYGIGSVGVSWQGAPPDLTDADTLFRKSIHDGDELLRIPAEKKLRPDFGFTMSFSEDSPGKGMPVPAALYGILSHIRNSIWPTIQQLGDGSQT